MESKKIAYGAVAAAAVLVVAGLGALGRGNPVDGAVNVLWLPYYFEARRSHPEEPTLLASMVRYAEDPAFPLGERSQMIDAIGRLADPAALPYLESRYTGEPCDHARVLCQYALSKAINRCGGKVVFQWADKKYNRS